MILHIRSSHADREGISIGQALTHFRLLTRTIGFIAATRAAINTAVQLFFRDGGGFGRGSGQENLEEIPFLPGSPRKWDMTVRNLIGVVEWYRKNGLNPDHIPDLINNLRDVMNASGNQPQNATVTIIIPAYNNLVEVICCIESIASWRTRVDYSIIVSDDASSLCSFSALGTIPGIWVIRNASNFGYIGNVNAAAKLVTTEYLITLNQDTITLPGWLDALVDELNNKPQNAIAGPRVLDRDFKILEAGALIFQDAHASHRGRGSFPDDSRHNYTRDVDYVSGCAMLVRTSSWNDLGGLSTLYEPAYYDHVDLCLRAHAKDLNVRYVPQSCIVHFEGTSMGKDETDQSSLKHFQNVNREKVAQQHGERLRTHTCIDETPHVESHFQSGTRVVYIFESVPRPDRDGGSVDFALIVDYLQDLGYIATALFTRAITPSQSSSWRAKGIRCAHIESPLGIESLEEADLIFSFGTMVGLYLREHQLPARPWIHHTSDIATRRLEHMNSVHANESPIILEASRWFMGLPHDVPSMWELEKPTLEAPTTTLFVTEDDLEFSLSHGALGNFEHFPILKCVPPTQDLPSPPKYPTIGFVGSFIHSPNPDAVEYFLRDIWPLITNQSSSVRFLVWGSSISSECYAKWSAVNGVEVRGWFATWEEVADQTRVLVSPLRFGVGMKHKVLSTLISGRSVIGTRISFDGLQTSLLPDSVMTDDPAQMASALFTVLSSDDAWTEALNAERNALGSNFFRSVEIQRLQDLVTRTFAK